jgi:hypothetical protein
MTLRALILLGLVVGQVMTYLKVSKQGKRIQALEGETGKEGKA